MLFNFIKKILKKKNKQNLLGVQKLEYNFNQWIQVILQKENIDLSLLNDLEILFIKSDIGVKTSSYFIQQFKQKIQEKKISKSKQLLTLIKNELISFYQKGNECIEQKNINTSKHKKQVFLFVGANGVGKTTTIGKLAFQFKEKGKKILLVAGDTFRTGAIEQLKIWGEKTNNEVFYKKGNVSPSSLFFEALTYANNNNFDIILCDTSGRLENKVNLMKELEKIKRVISKIFPEGPHKTFLILDAMTGQNGLKQIEAFNQVVPLTGIILTKLDGIGKGGLILTTKHIYNLPTEYIGIGEKANDLIEFDINHYIHTLFDYNFEINNN